MCMHVGCTEETHYGMFLNIVFEFRIQQVHKPQLEKQRIVYVTPIFFYIFFVACAHSFYGPNCRLRCSNTCINRTCDAEKGSCDMVQNEIGHKNSKASDIIGESREILFAVLTALVVVFVQKDCVELIDKKMLDSLHNR